MDNYGLTENEKKTSMHNYNHALFKNMMFFLDAVWEINVLNETVIIMEETVRPDRKGKEFPYNEVYEDFLNNLIEEHEKEKFKNHFSFSKVKGLTEEVSFDIYLKTSDDESELYNVVFTPAFDENHSLYSVYMCARNMQAEVKRELEEYHRQRKLLGALFSYSYFHISFDLTGDLLIKEDYITKDGLHLINELTGCEPPVSYETFIDCWFKRCNPQFEREDDRNKFSVKSLLNLYERKQHLVELEVRQSNILNPEKEHIMQIFIVLMTKPEDKHVKAYIVWKDISTFQRKTLQDNLQLRSSNEHLKNTLTQEQQYHIALLSGSLMVYNINLTKNLIEDEFYEIVDGQRIPMLDLMGLSAPCSFDEFCRRWCETKVPSESKEAFLKMFNREYMLNAYEHGERHIEIEFDTVLGRGILITLRSTALLLEDSQSGDILAMVNSKDVTKHREEELRKREVLRNAYEVANNANTAKTDFLTRLSNDFRTPMNAIIGMAAIAANHIDNTRRVTECLREITSSGKYLLSILTEVLDMSKIEAGKLRLTEKEFDLGEMFDNINMVGRFLCKEKEHDFSTRIDNMENTRVIGDAIKLQQIFMYLIDNSIKYTPNNGSIMVNVTQKPTDKDDVGLYEFVVEDNGIGMDEEYQQYIFEPFVRSEDSRVSKIQGVGLGLPIAKSLIQMMDGAILVNSELNKGTTITINLMFKLAK